MEGRVAKIGTGQAKPMWKSVTAAGESEWQEQTEANGKVKRG